MAGLSLSFSLSLSPLLIPTHGLSRSVEILSIWSVYGRVIIKQRASFLLLAVSLVICYLPTQYGEKNDGLFGRYVVSLCLSFYLCLSVSRSLCLSLCLSFSLSFALFLTTGC